ncbi:DUF4956 domain-containing protein [Lutimonas halocynthiae]|uniref:DUF4956 domain-containing protein n=1 Tax=Lutimonas halocynthiae TaxID=1446477 RepID=UPI0025B35CC3|nr:DUF4956 domain-containing protein [Lutimonas halocynthiae]MDN3643778.1 DUF4956 domain-containing protein [Lutimonas halocynthiae]
MEDLLFKSEFYEDINYSRFIVGIILLILLSKALQYVYRKYSDSPTNKKSFSSIFVLFSISIFLIVTTIKSSLALSLGMVGALSIIRFRTAIKEPEQMIYFLGITGVAIAIAAEKEILALIVVLVFVISAILNNKSNKDKRNSNLNYLLITLQLSEEHNDLDIVYELMKFDKTGNLKCKNFYEDDGYNLRLTFSVSNTENLDTTPLKQIIKSLDIKHFSLKMID